MSVRLIIVYLKAAVPSCKNSVKMSVYKEEVPFVCVCLSDRVCFCISGFVSVSVYLLIFSICLCYVFFPCLSGYIILCVFKCARLSIYPVYHF